MSTTKYRWHFNFHFFYVHFNLKKVFTSFWSFVLANVQFPRGFWLIIVSLFRIAFTTFAPGFTIAFFIRHLLSALPLGEDRRNEIQEKLCQICKDLKQCHSFPTICPYVRFLPFFYMINIFQTMYHKTIALFQA